jgi:hypothetical protein
VPVSVPANHSNLLYTAYSRRLFREEFASLNLQFDLRGDKTNPSLEVVKLRAIVSQLTAQLDAKPALTLPTEGGDPESEMSLELLKKRDQKINSLKLQVDQLQAENDKLLILLADQEMQITRLKNQ